MALDQNIGMVTAYAYAVSKGYTGTEEQFAQELASAGADLSQIQTQIDNFINTIVPAKTAEVTAEGTRQIGLVAAEGTAQKNAVTAEGTTQKNAVISEGTTQKNAVNSAGSTQVNAVNSAGSTQVGNVNTAGSTQVGAVQAKGQEVINSIPSDYTALSDDVDDLKSATVEEKITTVVPTNPRTACTVQYNGAMDTYAFYDTPAFASWKSYVYDVEPGQLYMAYGSKYPSTPTVVYMDSQGNYIGNDGYDIDYTEWVAVDNNITVRIPNNCTQMVVQKQGSSNTPIAKLVEYENNLLDDVELLQKDVEKISPLLVPDSTEPISITLRDGYYIGSTHIVAEISNTAYKVTDNITVTPGDDIEITASVGSVSNMYYCFYDAVGNYVDGVVSESATTEKFHVIVPNNASILVVSGYNGIATVESVETYKMKGTWDGKKWACIGDSLTQVNQTAAKRYYEYVADVTGISTENYGVGGTGYANPNGTAGNFIDRMASVSTDADVYTIFGSFNDVAYATSNDIPIGDPADAGTSTMCGYFNSAFDALYARVPLANIGVVAPCPWQYCYPGGTNQTSTYGKAYVEALRQVCERRSIPFLDLFHGSGMRPWDADFRALIYTDDPAGGVHPNAIGHSILAPKFKAFLESLIL